MAVLTGLFLSAFFRFSRTQSYTTTDFTFTTDSNYTFDSALVEVTAGVARLVLIDQTDNDNSATGFGGGVNSDTQWDTTNLWLELDSTGQTNGSGNFTSRILDATTSTATWTTLAWNPYRPYSKELPNNNATETDYLAGNFDMQSNVLLFHFNGSTSTAEEAGIILDSSGFANNGTLNTGSDGLNKSSSTAQFTSSTDFDGSNDYI